MLHKIELNNYCQYEHFVAEFKPGLNVVIGDNGSGKSNFLKSFIAAIDGDFSTNDGVKALNIRRGSDGKPANVILDADVGGELFRVCRGLQAAKSWLAIGDSPPIYGDEKATAALADKFTGPTGKVPVSACVLHQGELDAFLRRRFADRARELFRLFGLERIEDLSKFLNKKANEIVLQDFSENIANGLEVVKTRTAELQTLDDEIDKYADIADYDPAKSTAKDVIRKYDAAATAKRQLADLKAKLATAVDQVKSSEAQRDVVAAELRDAEAMLLELAAPAKAARELIARQASLVAEHRRKERIEAERKALRKPKEPEAKPGLVTDVAAASRQRDELKLKIQRLEDLLASVQSGKCISCQTPVSKLPNVAAAKAELPEVEKELATVERNLAAAKAYETAMQVYKGDIRRYNMMQDRHTQELAALADLEPLATAAELAEAGEAQSLEAETQQLVSTLKQRQARTDAELIAAKSVVADGKLQLHELRQQIADAPTKEEHEAAQEEFGNQLARFTILAKLRTDRRAADMALRAAVTLVESLQAKAKENEVAIDWAKYLRRLCELVHRESFPQRLAAARLKKLEPHINKLLESADVEFRVRVNAEELSYDAVKSDGVELATRLSGAQRVFLALAFHVVKTAALCNQYGFLCVDEPTTFVAKRNFNKVEKFLTALKTSCRRYNIQVIVSTNEDSLTNLFDNVIDVEQRNG